MNRFEKKDERNKKFIQTQGYDIWGRYVDKARVAEHDRRRGVKTK